jgi:hypothetical protein
VKSFNNAKKEMPKHFLPFDLIKTTPFDKEPFFVGFACEPLTHIVRECPK